MKNKFKFKLIVALSCLAMLLVAPACANLSKIEELQEQGYKVTVSYDANGGKYLGRPGITVVDMFKPANHTQDESGNYHIQLMEPTDKQRPTSGSDSISLTLSDNFFAGWYRNRTVQTNENGQPVDALGRELKLQDDGSYIVAATEGTDEVVTTTPAYTYSGYWDFDNDEIVYAAGENAVYVGGVKEDLDENGCFEMTLYAGWVQYYEFHYYYQNQSGEWVQLDKVDKFDYKTTNAKNSSTFDKDTIWTPDWKDGAMNHDYTYSNRERYSFPKIEGTTFVKAYTDSACQNEIGSSLEHKGTLDLETCTPVNRIQNVYITVEQGEKYKITTAEQLVNNANLNGIYEIQADLTFTDDIKWPTVFSYGTFMGQMYSTEGHNYKISNAKVQFNHASAKAGGLFGQIGKGATVKNLTFENVTFDLFGVGTRATDRQYGMFAGNIDAEANVSNLSVGGLMRIGEITLGSGCEVNLLANGNTAGITLTSKALQIYGTKRQSSSETFYMYTIDVANNSEAVLYDSETNEITLSFVTQKQLPNEKYDINLG